MLNENSNPIIDYRSNYLNVILNGLQKSIKILLLRKKEIEYYDEICILKDSEQIYGVVFGQFKII